MSVVELYGGLFRKFFPVRIVAKEAAYQVGHRTGDQKILLQETQTLAGGSVVVRIEDPRERFGLQGRSQCPDEVSAAKILEIKIVGCCRSPQPQCIDRLSTVPNDWAVEGYSEQT